MADSDSGFLGTETSSQNVNKNVRTAFIWCTNWEFGTVIVAIDGGGVCPNSTGVWTGRCTFPMSGMVFLLKHRNISTLAGSKFGIATKSGN
jgi:hypothetical protein